MYFTSIEQSKKLIELGIDPNTADMCYQYVKFDKENEIQYFASLSLPKKNDIPCWSTGALLNLLPKTIIDKDDDHEYNLFIDMASEMPYYIWCSDCYLSDFPNDFLGGDLISNLIKCIEWLKEYKYI